MNQYVQVADRTFTLSIAAADIQNAVARMGRELSIKFRDKDPLFLVVLNGAFMFASDLMKQVCIPAEVSFLRLASYQGMNSTGTVHVTGGLQEDIRDRHVILLEDIVDTGTTLHHFRPELLQLKPASLHIAACFTKPGALLYPDALPDFSCFILPERFVVGYGMDYNGYGRNLPDLYELVS